MGFIFIALITIGSIVLGGAVFVGYNHYTFKTEQQVQLNKYTGRWYEAYRTYISQTVTGEGPNAVCVVADYKAINSTTIQVRNTKRDYTSDGKIKDVFGKAYVINTETNAELEVDFQNKGKRGKANYYIMKLGPINQESNQYEWVLVGEPLRLFGWILVRNVEKFNNQYYDDIQLALKEAGYTHFYNTPIKTKQVNGCEYPELLD